MEEWRHGGMEAGREGGMEGGRVGGWEREREKKTLFIHDENITNGIFNDVVGKPRDRERESPSACPRPHQVLQARRAVLPAALIGVSLSNSSKHVHWSKATH